MPSIPERQTIRTDADELVMRSCRVGLPHLVETQPVKGLWIGEGVCVAGYAVGGDFDRCPSWKTDAVGEGYRFEDFALEGGWG
jgi:hypothetical protein